MKYQIDNPVLTVNKTIDKFIFNPIVEALPYVGSVIKFGHSVNKVYQGGGHVARAKAIYNDCQKKTKK